MAITPKHTEKSNTPEPTIAPKPYEIIYLSGEESESMLVVISGMLRPKANIMPFQ
jgi:hypothetical protein